MRHDRPPAIDPLSRFSRRFRLRNGLACLLAATALSIPLHAEDPAPAAAVQAKVSEWIKTLQLISAEKAGWETEKQTLTDLNEIRKSEIGKLDEFIRLAEDRVKELDEKRQSFAKEEEDMKQWRRDLEQRLAPLENEIRPLVKLFPLALREKVEEATIRLEENDPEAPLQNRMRDLLAIVQAALDFHRSLSWDNEIREIDGERREIGVLYLGLTQAYYVDQSGKYAGYGSPTPDGWKWVAAPEIASSVRLAIDVFRTNVPPRFVTLPLGHATNPSN